MLIKNEYVLEEGFEEVRDCHHVVVIDSEGEDILFYLSRISPIEGIPLHYQVVQSTSKSPNIDLLGELVILKN